jgi:two-component system sensor histidine kinase RstB
LNTLLVRILSGLVAVLAALSLFSLLVVNLTNQVRYEHYWTDLVSPPLVYLSQNQSVMAGSTLDSLSLVSSNQLAFSHALLTRLSAGQAVFVEEQNRFKAWVALQDNDLLLQLDSRADGEELYHFYLFLISQILESEKEASSLDTVQAKFNLDVSLLDSEALLEDIATLESLVGENRSVLFSEDKVTGFVRLVGGEIYKVSFPDAYSSFSWFVALLLFALGVSTLALVVYLMLLGLDRQLRNVETVASRIARGELDARVKRAANTDAVGRLGLAFNSMADHIQRLMYIQKEMIHAVSHELRTPVARIRFGVQMIEDCPDEKSLQKQISGIDGDIQELDELIDEILTYARLEQGGPILAFHEANIMEIVEQVVSEQSSVKPALNIVSEYRKGSELWKDSEVEARYIHRSIQNLVGNATRYAESTVKVICSFDQETFRVDVEDDGPGIPEEDWESVFTPFARLDDSRTRSSGGYGLGLSIVRRILYWHGGQAFLGRSTMGGAKFSLVWPRKQNNG